MNKELCSPVPLSKVIIMSKSSFLTCCYSTWNNVNFILSSSFCNSAPVQVKFSRSLVSTTEEEGQAIITVLAMGDLSFDFSIIVMAVNGSAVGELLG